MRRGIAVTGIVVGALTLGPGVAFAGVAASITATEGQQFMGTVDTIAAQCGSIANVTIDWGDGTPTSAGGKFESGVNSCGIEGSHTYAEEGSHSTTVTYPLASGGLTNDVGTATVGDAPLTLPAVNDFTVTDGTPLSNVVVADWEDPVTEPLSSYSATINRGDGISSAGVIGNGTVSGSHTYLDGGRFTIRVTVNDEGGASGQTGERAYVSGCPTAAPSTPSQLFKPSATGLDARWVEAVWHDVLGRDPSYGELLPAVQDLSLGVTRSQFALALLQSSEYRQNLIASDFQAYLHRAPTGGETGFWVSELGMGVSDEAVAADVLGSGEYYADRGNSSTDGFLGALYCDAVFRSIDQFAQNNDDAALGGGTSRTTIAGGLVSSAEYREDLVRGYFLHYLRRAGTAGELGYFAAIIQSGGTDEQVIASMLASPEYFDLFNPVVAFATISITHGGTISTTLSRAATLSLTVLHKAKLANTASVQIHPPQTRLLGVVSLGHHRKGRVTLHWNLKVRGHTMKRGTYLLMLKAYGRHHRLIGISDAVPLTVR